MEKSQFEQLPSNPLEKASIFSYLTFWWVLPIFAKGRKQELNSKDLYNALKTHKSDNLGSQLTKSWEAELCSKGNRKKEPSLQNTTLSVFGWNIVLHGLLLFFIEFVLKLSQPIFLGELIKNYSNQTEEHISLSYQYAGALILSSFITMVAMHCFMFGSLHIGMKIRIAMSSMMYRKALRLSLISLANNTTIGQIVNLFSNDVGRMDYAFLFIHYLWVGPIQTVVVTVLLYQKIELAALVGVGFLIALVPLQIYLGKKTSDLRLKTAVRTDDRVRFMNEIIEGIQVIKMYAWENAFCSVIDTIRRNEVRMIRFVSYIKGILLSFIMFTTRVSIFASLIAFVLLESVGLDPETAFIVTAYYRILLPTMTIFFPQGIAQVAEARVSFKRIQTFMVQNETELQEKPDPEKTHDKLTTTLSNGAEPISKRMISVNNMKARWSKATNEFSLNDIAFSVDEGTMVAFIGPVGCGKSSMIQAILGELVPEQGTIQVNGTISYAPQEPWLFSSSVQQNILFGEVMDKKRYKKVLKICALDKDLVSFPYGDKTLVGERGQSLSGGQKARISLARAVYRRASIYLLDDPLGAVDVHVGRHIFTHCLTNFLKGSTVVLVTHQLQFLHHVDQLIILDNGKILDKGSYQYLQTSGLNFAELLGTEDATSDPNDTKKLQRQESNTSLQSLESKDDGETNKGPAENVEATMKGAIPFKTYGQYLSAGGSAFLSILVILSFIAAQGFASGGDYFLSYWVNAEQNRENIFQVNSTENTMETDFQEDRETAIYIFTGITVLTVIISLARSFIFFQTAMRASKNLHNYMFEGVIKTSLYFFNTNPSGRILNRFSKDMGQIDELLPSVIVDVIQIFLTLTGIIVVIAIVNPVHLVPTVLIGIIFYYMRKIYITTSRNVKRIEAVARSPLLSHLSASLNGLSIIRAFCVQKLLTEEFDNHQDGHSSSFYMYLACSRAFGFYLDFFCVIFIAIVTGSFFVMGNSSSGDLGLAITQAMGITGMVQWGMRQTAELENMMTAVERVVEYKELKPEDESTKTNVDKILPANWPSTGRIDVKNLSLRYTPSTNETPVLKNVNFSIAPGAKIGIVGRTGAGKSSLINALMRLSFNEGAIIIDEHDIGYIKLQQLRSKMSIIPQAPVLFSGTMRYNLDPFDDYPDDKLWMVLEDVKLKTYIQQLPSGLQMQISAGGANFSVGQRQLVCLARAILRDNKILILDEATANVDPQTDALIQTTIKERFKDCTVLTIAHRLNTVAESDYVLVMNAGEMVEFGKPYELLTATTAANGEHYFKSMVQELGPDMFEQLCDKAKTVFNKGVVTSL